MIKFTGKITEIADYGVVATIYERDNNRFLIHRPDAALVVGDEVVIESTWEKCTEVLTAKKESKNV